MHLNCDIGEDSWVPWITRRSNQSILKEISPEYSLEGLMLKLKFHYWSSDMNSWFTGNIPDAGKDWGQKEKKVSEDEIGWMASQMQWVWTWANFRRSEGQRDLECCSPWGQKKSDTTDFFQHCWIIAMLPMANLTSHSRMSIVRWVATPIWLFGSLLLLLFFFNIVLLCILVTSS